MCWDKTAPPSGQAKLRTSRQLEMPDNLKYLLLLHPTYSSLPSGQSITPSHHVVRDWHNPIWHLYWELEQAETHANAISQRNHRHTRRHAWAKRHLSQHFQWLTWNYAKIMSMFPRIADWEIRYLHFCLVKSTLFLTTVLKTQRKFRKNNISNIYSFSCVPLVIVIEQNNWLNICLIKWLADSNVRSYVYGAGKRWSNNCNLCDHFITV
jgi:hypothetical protein